MGSRTGLNPTSWGASPLLTQPSPGPGRKRVWSFGFASVLGATSSWATVGRRQHELDEEGFSLVLDGEGEMSKDGNVFAYVLVI
jgi:hypothetical protein